MKMNEGAESRALALTIGTPVDQVFECCWDSCDWQFEDMTDCIDHCIAEQNGHVQSSFINAPSGNFLFIYLFMQKCFYYFINYFKKYK